jgi:hypothetical protein
MIQQTDDRPMLYFAVYVDIGQYTPQKAKEQLESFRSSLTNDNDTSPYREKFFIMPCRNQPTKIELLYPTPFLSREQAEELYESYYSKYQHLIQDIQNLN